MPTKDGPKRRIKTADTVVDILELLREMDGATTAELAEQLGMATSTTHGYVSTLEDRGLLVYADGEYSLGLRSLEFGMHAKNKIPATRVIEPVLEQLADETGELTWFTVEEHGYAVDLERAAGKNAVAIGTWIGKRKQMHHLAAGKAILAYLPENRVREIIDQHGLPELTENTITEADELFEELAEIRDRGIAYNNEETTRGIRAVGAPILVDETPLGGISISGPARRMVGDCYRETYPNLLLAATNEVELKIRSQQS